MLSGKPKEAELSYARALNAMDTRIKTKQVVDNDPNHKMNQIEQMQSYKAYALALVGNSLQAQQKLIEAEYYHREALKIYLGLGGKNSNRVARAIARLSQVITEQGRY